MPSAIDTLNVYERLRAADISDKAAKEIAAVIKETIEEKLITKEYLDLRLAELKSEITTNIIKWAAGMLIA